MNEHIVCSKQAIFSLKSLRDKNAFVGNGQASHQPIFSITIDQCQIGSD